MGTIICKKRKVEDIQDRWQKEQNDSNHGSWGMNLANLKGGSRIELSNTTSSEALSYRTLKENEERTKRTDKYSTENVILLSGGRNRSPEENLEPQSKTPEITSTTSSEREKGDDTIRTTDETTHNENRSRVLSTPRQPMEHTESSMLDQTHSLTHSNQTVEEGSLDKNHSMAYSNQAFDEKDMLTQISTVSLEPAPSLSVTSNMMQPSEHTPRSQQVVTSHSCVELWSEKEDEKSSLSSKMLLNDAYNVETIPVQPQTDPLNKEADRGMPSLGSSEQGHEQPRANVNTGNSDTNPPHNVTVINVDSRNQSSNVNIEMKNNSGKLQHQFKDLIRSYADEDRMFVETKAFKTSRTLLKVNKIITLTGMPGEGKTFLARHILLDSLNNDDNQYKRDEAVIIDSPEDWKNLINLRKRQLVLIEDIFGATNLSREKLDKWRTLIDMIYRVVKKNEGKILVVVTCRRNILQEAKQLCPNLPIFDQKHIIDLAENEMVLNKEERKKILLSHVQSLEEKEVETIVQASVPHGFPYCCRIFSNNPKFRAKGSDFFINPVDYIMEEIQRLQTSEQDRAKYCALVLCMLNDGQISILDVDLSRLQTQDADRLRKIFEVCEIPSEQSSTSLIQAFDNLKGLYFIQRDDIYTFIHPCILESVAEAFSRFTPSAIVELCSINFLHERVRTNRNSTSDHSFSLVLHPATFEHLGRRFNRDIFSGRIKGILQHQACGDENFRQIWIKVLTGKKLVSKILSVVDKQGRSMLYWCSWTGNFKLLVYLLSSLDTDINEEYLMDQKNKCLVVASFYGYDDIANYLLRNFTSTSYRDELANRNICEKYTAFGFYLGRLMYVGPTALHAAACGGHQILVEKLLYYKANANAQDSEGCTALHCACCAGHYNVVESLLRNKANVNAQNIYMRTPLHIVAGSFYAMDWDPNVKRYFDIEENACPVAVDKTHQITRQTQVTHLLLENGASLDLQDYDGHTPLHTAMNHGRLHVAQILLDHGADVNVYSNTMGDTPLHVSSNAGKHECCRLLLERGANVNARCKSQRGTPLHSAVYQGNLQTVRVLVEFGADISLRQSNNESALEIAEKLGYEDIAQFLLEQKVQ